MEAFLVSWESGINLLPGLERQFLSPRFLVLTPSLVAPVRPYPEVRLPAVSIGLRCDAVTNRTPYTPSRRPVKEK